MSNKLESLQEEYNKAKQKADTYGHGMEYLDYGKFAPLHFMWQRLADRLLKLIESIKQ